MKNFEENMNAFTFREHQDFITYLLTLRQCGLRVEDAENYVKEKQKSLEEKKTNFLRPMLRDCTCGATMFLLPINTVPGNQTGDDSQSVWLCQNRSCMETIYNKQSIDEIMGGR